MRADRGMRAVLQNFTPLGFGVWSIALPVENPLIAFDGHCGAPRLQAQRVYHFSPPYNHTLGGFDSRRLTL